MVEEDANFFKLMQVFLISWTD